MTGIYVSCALGLLSFIAFVIKCRKKRSVEGVYIKNVVSLFFIATAFSGVMFIINTYNSGSRGMLQYGVIVMFGLILGMLGDIYLDQKWVYPEHEKQYLYAGFITFLIGHIFYMVSIFMKLSEYVKLKPVHFIAAAAIAILIDIINLLLEKPTKQHYGSYKLIVTVYTFFVAGTFGSALTAAFFTRGTDAFVPFIIYAVGAALFLISDIILSPMYFGDGSKNTPANFILNHATYYIGQYIFALTIVLFSIRSIA